MAVEEESKKTTISLKPIAGVKIGDDVVSVSHSLSSMAVEGGSLKPIAGVKIGDDVVSVSHSLCSMAVEGGSKKTTISLKPIAGVKIGDDVVIIEVSPEIANHMKVIQAFIGEDSFDASSAVIPLHNITVFELKKIIQCLDFHETVRKAKVEVSVKEFEKIFMEDVDRNQLLELILAADYLDVPVALDFLSKKVADVIENRSIKFVRDYLGIVTDYTLLEEEANRKKHTWAYKGVDPDTDVEDDSDNDDDTADVKKKVDNGEVKKTVGEDKEGAGKTVDEN